MLEEFPSMQLDYNLATYADILAKTSPGTKSFSRASNDFVFPNPSPLSCYQQRYDCLAMNTYQSPFTEQIEFAMYIYRRNWVCIDKVMKNIYKKHIYHDKFYLYLWIPP